MKTVLLICLVFSAGQKEEAVKAPALKEPASQKEIVAEDSGQEQSDKKGLETEAPEVVADTPPPSAYDRQERLPKQESVAHEDSLSTYLARTVFSLILIVGLMYFLAKLVLPRYLQGFRPNSKAQHIKVLERTPLDAKHSVYVLELEDGERILVGTGEKGVQFLTRVDRSTNDKTVSKEFNSLLEPQNEEETLEEKAV